MPRTVKVAVVGSGLAGLTAAWLLTRPLKNRDHVQFEVHLFEKADSLGMDSSSISLTDSKSGAQWRIDVPLRAIQQGYYPQLIAMYRSLGIKIRRANFSYSFSLFTPSTPTAKREITTTFIYNGSSGMAGFGKPSSLFTANQNTHHHLPHPFNAYVSQLWSWLVFVSISLGTILCFLISAFHAAPFFRSPALANKSFGDWAKDVTPKGFLARWTGLDILWQNYVRDIMIPMWSCVCTATVEDIMNYPALDFLDFIWLTFGTPYYLVANGVRDVVAELTKDLKHIHLSSPITSIALDPKAPHLASVTFTKPSGEQRTLHGFDHVIFATEAKAAASILNSWASTLPDCSLGDSKTHTTFKENIQEQVQVLSKFRYRTTVVINHVDDTLLPDNPRDHRKLNLISYHGHDSLVHETSEKDPDRDSSICVASSFVMATHALPKPEGFPSHLPTVYQSTNPYIPPKKGSILSVARMERAIPTVESRIALRAFCKEMDHVNRKWWECPAIAKTELGPLQGAGRQLTGERRNPGIWICGSYAYPGIPLLEGCVVSAKNVVVQGILKCEGGELKEEPWAIWRGF